ncbi:atp-binding cassette sub-family b [Holotrichia oblita]|uniref:Atp-binding cassette sub-family b n=1 Tax=Holotrichia oblita TaxID=644536 RepID=A0ACB9SMM1_HOLOL|nr:atp-binding cassette sub-family b [Holotrichia oblita]
MKKKIQINTNAAVDEYNKNKKDGHSLELRFQESEHTTKKNKNDTKSGDQLKRVSYFNLYRYSTLRDKFMIFIAVACALAAGVGIPLVMIFFGNVTGSIVTFAVQLQNMPDGMDTTDIENDLMDVVISFVVNCFIVAGSIFLLTYVSITLFSITCTNQICKIRALFMKHVLNQDVGWYDVNQTGDFTSRITDDILKIEEGIGDKVSTCCFFISTFVSGVAVAFSYGWELALICLISFPVNTIALGVIAWLTTKFSLREMESYGSAGAIAEEVLGAIKTVMAFGGQQKEIDRYKVHLQTACKNNITRALLTGISNGVMWFVMFASYALSFYYGIGLIIDERDLPLDQQTYNAGTMITVFFSVLMAMFTLTQCMPYFQIFGTSQGAAAKIFSVIDHQPEINLSRGKGVKIENCKGRIKFEDVHFNYPARKDVPILKGVNLEINPGDTVALVGSSGCGKSTCIQLLQRFYDPINGRVTIDGEDIKNLDLDWYRSKIGVVGQEPVLFAMTIAENIKFGNKAATEKDIISAAKKANAHNFISTLPDGYRTLVGDRGSQLSGGQKQRIAIARALVREPTILLLDEATSALDTHSEALVQEAIDSISKDCTTIIIAHRLSTIRNANKIIVFSEGQIVETGTHDELMALKSAYYNLVVTQISGSDLERDGLQRTNSYAEEENIEQIFTKDTSDIVEEEVTNWSAIFNVLALNKPEWWQIILGAIGAAVSGAAMPVYAIIFGDVMGVFAYPNPEDIRREGNKYSLYFLLIGIACGTAMFFQWYMIGIAGEKLTKRVRALLFETVLRQEPAWFDDKQNSVGAVCAKLSSDGANIQGASGHPVIVALNSISTLLIAITISLIIEWRLALASMSFMPLIFLGTYFETSYLQGGGNGGDKHALENSAKIAVDAIGNIRTVASLGCEETFYTLYTTELLPVYKKAKRAAHIRGFLLGLSRSLMNIAYVIAFWYGGSLIVNEKLDYSKVFQVSEALITAAWSVGNVMAFSPNFQKGIIAANKMFKLMKREPKIKDDANSTYTSWPRGDITYKEVVFKYPTRPNTTILDSLDLFVTQGKTIALVGPSGCGKSTIIQLLQRFYDPDSGTASIDDINLKNIKVTALRSHLGIVSQEPNLFDRTIEENIAYGDNQRVVTQAEIIEAAKNANIHSFISSLPLGYNTRLGERGTQLSGGQKQRVAIARALVRNPNILLLDEATSALDMESEKIVQEALDKAKLGRTCITIAHRLTTIQDADIICVLNKGKIVEQGSHSELLGLKGLYHKLYTMQKKNH